LALGISKQLKAKTISECISSKRRRSTCHKNENAYAGPYCIQKRLKIKLKPNMFICSFSSFLHGPLQVFWQ
jgi:hypothetical protein